MRHSVVALHMEVIVWYILCDAFGKICFNNLVLIVFLIFCSFVPICTLFLLLYVEVRTDFSLENGRLELLIQSSWDSTMAGICDWMDMYALNFVGLMCKFCLNIKASWLDLFWRLNSWQLPSQHNKVIFLYVEIFEKWHCLHLLLWNPWWRLCTYA